ncbi:MAG: hypothetical protein ACOVS5_07700 [Oligoflexus sp.]|jgi:hypothetical protein
MAANRTIINVSHDPAFQLILVKAVTKAMNASTLMFSPASLIGPLCAHIHQLNKAAELIPFLNAYPQSGFIPKNDAGAEMAPHTTTITLNRSDLDLVDLLKINIGVVTGKEPSRTAVVTAAFIWAVQEPLPSFRL